MLATIWRSGIKILKMLPTSTCHQRLCSLMTDFGDKNVGDSFQMSTPEKMSSNSNSRCHQILCWKLWIFRWWFRNLKNESLRVRLHLSSSRKGKSILEYKLWVMELRLRNRHFYSTFPRSVYNRHFERQFMVFWFCKN